MALFHAWYKNVLPHAMANNTLKYKRVDAAQRVQKQQEWNQPQIMPLILFVLLLLLIGFVSHRVYQNRQKAVVTKEEQ